MLNGIFTYIRPTFMVNVEVNRPYIEHLGYALFSIQILL